MALYKFTDEDRVIFAEIATEINSNPDKYREAGKWFDEYCKEDAFIDRVKQKKTIEATPSSKLENDMMKICEAALKAGIDYDNERMILRLILTKRALTLNDTISHKEVQFIKYHLLLKKISKKGTELKDYCLDAMDFCIEKWSNMPSLDFVNVRRILLITWLITDQNINTPYSNITRFEKLSWDDRSRPFFDLIAPGKRRRERWMEVTNTVWQVINSESHRRVLSAEIEQETNDNGENIEIESKETSSGFSVKNGQVFYDAKDLGFPAGQIQDYFEQLIDNMGLTVTYDELSSIADLPKIRVHKSKASRILEAKSVPYEIATITNEGYILRPTTE